MRYWLMKSEPDCYSVDDLAAAKGPAMWEGCRNYTVRNFFRDLFQPGDLAFFHHSSTKPAGLVGVMKVMSTAYPDPTQFDPDSDYFDAKAKRESPPWLVVDVELLEKFEGTVTLDDLRANPVTAPMQVLRRGQRLSVMPVEPEEWEAALKMGREKKG